MSSLKVKVSFPASMMEARGLVDLGRLSVDDLDLSSWWRILAAKLDVSVRIYVIADMAIDANK